MDVNVSRNDSIRQMVKNLFENFGVSKKFFAECAGLDYGLFTKWVGGKKNYIDNNIDKIEMILSDKYGQFRQ